MECFRPGHHFKLSVDFLRLPKRLLILAKEPVELLHPRCVFQLVVLSAHLRLLIATGRLVLLLFLKGVDLYAHQVHDRVEQGIQIHSLSIEDLFLAVEVLVI